MSVALLAVFSRTSPRRPLLLPVLTKPPPRPSPSPRKVFATEDCAQSAAAEGWDRRESAGDSWPRRQVSLLRLRSPQFTLNKLNNYKITVLGSSPPVRLWQIDVFSLIAFKNIEELILLLHLFFCIFFGGIKRFERELELLCLCHHC
jgi:hypothetical protein